MLGSLENGLATGIKGPWLAIHIHLCSQCSCHIADLLIAHQWLRTSGLQVQDVSDEQGACIMRQITCRIRYRSRMEAGVLALRQRSLTGSSSLRSWGVDHGKSFTRAHSTGLPKFFCSPAITPFVRHNACTCYIWQLESGFANSLEQTLPA